MTPRPLGRLRDGLVPMIAVWAGTTFVLTALTFGTISVCQANVGADQRQCATDSYAQVARLSIIVAAAGLGFVAVFGRRGWLATAAAGVVAVGILLAWGGAQ
ncbi:MAG: hypothetical protein HYX34_05985 [Actinobacteria bacterium]|nr:hypothetical protein [Actinomycetota bacterium]